MLTEEQLFISSIIIAQNNFVQTRRDCKYVQLYLHHIRVPFRLTSRIKPSRGSVGR